MLTFFEFVKNKSLNKKIIKQYGKYKVALVNGDAVRCSSKEAQEFGGSSYHALLPKVIPENEIWIEDDVKPQEREVLISSALYEIRFVERGMPVGKAYDKGLAKEKDYRESVLLSKEQPWKSDKPADKSLYMKKYGHIDNEDIEVWLVDGEKVRNRYKTDFIEGGHGYVYKWVPNREIWLEYGPHIQEEAPLILLHEYVERTLMKYKKMSYDKAHDIAAKCEWAKRKNSFDKKQALSLTKDEALRLAKEA